MIAIDVRVDIARVTAKLNATREAVIGKATVRALNKTAAQAKVAASREIRDAGYKIKAGAIKDSIRITQATRALLVSAVKPKGRPIPLIDYGARQTAKGVTVSVKNGRKLIRGAFIAVMPTGHKGVFVRVGDGRKKVKGKSSGLPIKELFGPSIPAAFKNEVVMGALMRFVREKFPKIFEHELGYALSKDRG